MTRRILHIISGGLPTGAALQLELLCQGLRAAGYETHVCSLQRRGPGRDGLPTFGGRLSFCSQDWRVDPLLLTRLRSSIQAIQPDVVHTWGSAANTYGRLASISTGRRRLVASVRELPPGRRPLPMSWQRWLIARTFRLVVNGAHIKDFLIRRNLPTDRIEVIRNGVSAPSQALAPQGRLQQQLGLPTDAVLIGAVGELRAEKRLQDLIWALDLLRVLRPEVRLVIVGDGPERSRLEEFARRTNARQAVHFLGRRSDVAELLPEFSCFWQASKRQGCSNALLEAMAAGLPVVCSNVAGHRDIVADGERGRLVPWGDRAEFARKTNLLLQDREQARAWGEAGRAFVAENFSVESMVAAHRRIYECREGDRLKSWAA